MFSIELLSSFTKERAEPAPAPIHLVIARYACMQQAGMVRHAPPIGAEADSNLPACRQLRKKLLMSKQPAHPPIPSLPRAAALQTPSW
jgi:hypothetical protein